MSSPTAKEMHLLAKLNSPVIVEVFKNIDRCAKDGKLFYSKSLPNHEADYISYYDIGIMSIDDVMRVLVPLGYHCYIEPHEVGFGYPELIISWENPTL